MPQAEIQKGCTEIKKWIQNFDYDELYRDVYNEEKLAELYFAETNDYLKIQLFRALFEVNPSREIKEEDVLVKFINESYHIENDYAYYLDMVKFETVPEYIVIKLLMIIWRGLIQKRDTHMIPKFLKI